MHNWELSYEKDNEESVFFLTLSGRWRKLERVGGGGISFSPNHAEDGWEETGKTKSEHADCRESKSSGRRRRGSPRRRAATPCFSWQVRVTTRNLEPCNEWLNEQKQKKMSFAPDGPPSSSRVRASFFFVSMIKWANLSFFYQHESHSSSKCQILRFIYFNQMILLFIVSLLHQCIVQD